MGIAFFPTFYGKFNNNNTKKVNSVWEDCPDKSIAAEIFGVISVVEGCFSALVHELTPFLFPLSLH